MKLSITLSEGMNHITRDFDFTYDQLINFAANDAIEDMSDTLGNSMHEDKMDHNNNPLNKQYDTPEL
jgi:hypothetical protein